MTTLKHKKIIKPRYFVYGALLVLIILNSAGLVALWHHDRGRLRAHDSQFDTLIANQAASQGPSYYDVTIAPRDKAVYLPLAKLKLPDTALTEGLVYTYTDDYTVPGIKKVFPARLAISTHDLIANDASTTQQFDCSQVAYADFVTPSYPVNPMVTFAGSTKLADGRTMNIYYSPSIPGCTAAWQLNNIDSKAIAESLRAAASF